MRYATSTMVSPMSRLLCAMVCIAGWASTAHGQEVFMVIDGEGTIDFLRQTADCGDVDSRGVPDFVIGARDTGAGRIRVIAGEDGATISEYLGIEVGGLGEELAGIGDFDGNGTLDFAAGVKWSDVPASNAGQVWVFDGPSASPIAVIDGPGANFLLGRSLAAIGDVNQDGFADIIAGGFYGEVRVYAGPSGSLMRTHDGPGTRPSVAGVGDMDLDGFPDYLIGWPQDSTAGQWAGRVTVFSGRTGAEIHTVFGLHAANVPSFYGDHLGFSSAGLGDVNGDGYPDFLVAAPGELGNGFTGSRGFATVYSGLDAEILYNVDTGTDATANFGTKLAAGGDVNGDGVGDFMVGSPRENVYAIGITQGAVSTFSGKTGQMLWKRSGGPWDNHPLDKGIGEYMAILGDMTGDGRAEFAIGMWEANYSFPYAGRIMVFAGAPGDATSVCASGTNSSGERALIDAQGPITSGTTLLSLTVVGSVPGQFGLFYYGPEAASTPFGNGIGCVGGGATGFFRLEPALLSDAAGAGSRAIDFASPPVDAGPGAWSAGSTWFVQYWFRDPAAGGAAFDLSDALELQLTPGTPGSGG